uniref:Dolichyl-diphosphooligosaccharide--protein glycosyltransferase subunit DAD1 n=1 Tax=Leersia perrieri TaxID=77586 RepID=A0A0D9W4D8_9ORYZ
MAQQRQWPDSHLSPPSLLPLPLPLGLLPPLPSPLVAEPISTPREPAATGAGVCTSPFVSKAIWSAWQCPQFRAEFRILGASFPKSDFDTCYASYLKHRRRTVFRMPRATSDAKLLIQSLGKAYAATPTNLKIIDLYVVFAVATALIQVVYMGIVGSFPFNSFLSGVLSCIGTAVLAVCLRIQVNKDNKEFKDLTPERAFADFVLCNLVLHLVIMNFLG